MSVPPGRDSDKDLGSRFRPTWISEEESVKRTVDNILSAREKSRSRSRSPNIVISSDVQPSTSSAAEKPKKQVGMDRYITVLKRKRSPTSAQTSSDAKASKTDAKASKTDRVGTPRDQNRFALLQTDEPEVPRRSFKPPPIYLRESTSNRLVQEIVKSIGENTFSVTSIRHGTINETKIQVKSENDFRKLSSQLEGNRKDFYTYQLKSAKGLQVVIKGIDPCVDSGEIKAGLIKEGYKIKSVMNVRNREKIPQPMFRVEMEPGDVVLRRNETHPIYNLRYLLHRRITVEEPHKRLGPVQCLNCQEFGHTKAYCRLPSVCVACGELHATAQCNKSKTDSEIKKCSNCGGNHTANYRGCPVYTHLKHIRTNRSSALPDRPQQPNSASNDNFPQIAQSTGHVNATNSRQVSYANVVRSNMPGSEQETTQQRNEPHINNLEASLQSLTQSIQNFTASMTSMMQEMLKMQSTILQAILKK